MISCFALFMQYFDLHDMFVRWVNLPQCKDKQLDYSQFLKALGRFEDIPEQEKVWREAMDVRSTCDGTFFPVWLGSSVLETNSHLSSSGTLKNVTAEIVEFPTIVFWRRVSVPKYDATEQAMICTGGGERGSTAFL